MKAFEQVAAVCWLLLTQNSSHTFRGGIYAAIGFFLAVLLFSDANNRK